MDSLTESSVSWKGVKNSLLKKDSEQHIGTRTLTKGDGVPGAPVTELEYKHYFVMPYLKRLIWRHISESGVVPRVYNLVPETD